MRASWGMQFQSTSLRQQETYILYIRRKLQDLAVAILHCQTRRIECKSTDIVLFHALSEKRVGFLLRSGATATSKPHLNGLLRALYWAARAQHACSRNNH